MDDSCKCMIPPFDYRIYRTEEVGVDKTNGRFGEVTIKTCLHCGARWLDYHVEYEAFTASGRWYRGLLTPEMEAGLTPENAVALLESMRWHFYGGSYFNTTGRPGTGAVYVD